MNQLQMAIAVMAALDIRGGPRDGEGRPRPYTVAELDALADVGWHMPDVRGVVTACLTAVRGRWHPASRTRRGRAPLAAAESR
jgi:hypothetical protein